MMKTRQRRQQQPQENFDNYDDGGGYSNEDFDDQREEVQYVNNYQGNRVSQGNQQWRSQVEDVVEQSASDDVRIEIDEGEEETQEAMNPSREHVIDMPEPVVTKAKEPLPRPPLPYPQRLAKQKGDNQFKKFIEMMESLTINVPLVEELEQMSGYAKFMKDLVTKKRSMECETIKMTHQVSSIVHSMAPKLEDPGAFTIPCTIGSADFAKALCDLGGMDFEVPIILGRPFLATGKALVDVEVGELTFRVKDEKVVFHVCKSMRQLNSTEICSFVDIVTAVIVDVTSIMANIEDPLGAVLLNMDVDDNAGRFVDFSGTICAKEGRNDGGDQGQQ
ncbi:uncharacterized protein [Nicotiana sylvestris]|uniref:uncharacterized protein n=1 Tax=Nicotiana sylvestris TaxID=4096 RepID=UPI00388C57C9